MTVVAPESTTPVVKLSRKAQLVEEIFTGNYGFLRMVSGQYGLHRLNKNKFKGKEAIEAIKWGVSQGWLTTEPYERKWSYFVDDHSPVYTLHQPTPFFLPAELLWELLKPAIERCSGFSITKQEEWYKLGVEPRGTKYFEQFPDINMEKMCEALGVLTRHNYIWWQTCGDVWHIEVKK